MTEAPAGFRTLPGGELGSAVFLVERAGVAYVCKRLPARLLSEAWMRERLAAEGRVLAALAGRGAPRLVAAGDDGHGPWLVTERIPWPELGARAGRVDASWVGRAARAGFGALAALHAADVVHADLAPSNVLVSDDGGRAVIVDLGLARSPLLPPMPAGPFRGTLAFAAPEVARGEPFDGRADLFALAACMLHVASGEPPRAGSSEAAMLVAAAEESIEPWARRCAAPLEPAIAAALVACCAADPRARPTSAPELVAAWGEAPRDVG